MDGSLNREYEPAALHCRPVMLAPLVGQLLANSSQSGQLFGGQRSIVLHHPHVVAQLFDRVWADDQRRDSRQAKA